MRSRSVWLAVAGVAAAAAVVAAAWSYRASGPAGEAIAPDGAEGARPGEAAAVPGAAARLAQANPAAAGARGNVAASGRGAVVGTVRREGKPAPARVEVFFSRPVGLSVPDWREADYWSARFTARRATTEPVSARAGADGRYVVEGCGPGEYIVVAAAEDGAAGVATGTVLAEGTRAEVDVDLLAHGETLRGRIVRADGAPWRGTVLLEGDAVLNARAAAGAAPLSTDEAGRFVVANLTRGSLSVIALQEGAMRARGLPVRIPATEEFVLTLPGGLAPLAGRAVSAADGAPVAGADVYAFGKAPGVVAITHRVLTDAEGRFSVLSTGNETMLNVFAAGFAPANLSGDEAKPPVEVRLSKSAHVVGRVTSAADGTPVGGVVVHMRRGDDAKTTATSDADGRYRMDDLPDGATAVWACGGGWISSGLVAAGDPGAKSPFAVVIAPGAETVVDLRVVRGQRIVGTVRDAGGDPVAGAYVIAHAVVSGSDTAAPAQYAGAENTAVSAADGAFVLPSCVPGVEYVLVASVPGIARGEAGPVAVVLGAETRVDITLPAARWADVTVVDAAGGAPIPGAAVTVWPTSDDYSPDFALSDVASTALRRTTDASGVVRLGPLPAGELQVSATAEGWVDAAAATIEGSGGAVETLSAVIRMERGFSIAGRVLASDGTPASGVRVNAVREQESSSRRGDAAMTDASGAFVLSGLRAGRYTVQAALWREHGSLHAEGAGETGGSEVVLRLPASKVSRTTVVSVLDTEGKPVPAFTAEFGHQHPGRGGTSTSSVGASKGRAAFHWDDVPEGVTVVSIDVYAAKAADGTPLPLGPARLEDLLPDREYEVRLPPERAISGRVVDARGNGVAGARVGATPWKEGEDRFRSRFGGDDSDGVATDAEGAFRVGGLGAGEYGLHVVPPATFVRPPTVRAAAGASGVSVALRAAANPKVTVLDAEGRPVARAQVEATEDGDYAPARFQFPDSWNVTGPDGAMRIPHLDPAGVYELRVDVAPQRTDLAPYRKSGWTPADTTVRLERGYVLGGVVRDAGGRPVAGATVECDASEETVDTEGDGAFSFAGVRAGQATLTADIECRPIKDGLVGHAVLTVTVPTGDVVLVLDPGVTLTARIGGWRPKPGSTRYAFLSEEGGDERQVGGQEIAEDGVVRFRGLAPRTSYVLWASLDDDRYAYATGLRAGGGEVSVPAAQGKPITGRVVGGAAEAQVVVVQRGVHQHCDIRADGTFRLDGLPPGTWTVRTYVFQGGRPLVGVAEIPAGGSGDLRLAPAKK